MSSLLAIAVAGIASMTAAFERGDVDEAARQGANAGPAIVEEALGSHQRTTVLAGIAAAPEVEDRIELLPRLARLAAGSDRRIAIPAARAASLIAKRSAHVTDDVPHVVLLESRDAWLALALRADRWIEVRTAALEVAAAIDDLDLPAILKDKDPVVRLVAVQLVARPVPEGLRAPLAEAIANDGDPRVALAAASVVCADLPAPSAAIVARVKALLADDPSDPSARDARRCLK